MKLKCLIVDDEPRSHLVLEKYISQLAYAEVIGNCHDAIQAYHFVKDNKVDVVLLDINMPEIDGFAFLDMIEVKPVIIFTTAYSDFALRAYEYNAIDYLHKPIRFERFVKAMEKALKWKGLKVEKEIQPLEIKVDGRLVRLVADEINYIQSLGNFVKIFCDRKTYVTATTTKELEAKLPLPYFIRVHKSFIVNASRISGVGEVSVDLNGTSIPIGKTYKKYIEEFVNRERGMT